MQRQLKNKKQNKKKPFAARKVHLTLNINKSNPGFVLTQQLSLPINALWVIAPVFLLIPPPQCNVKVDTVGDKILNSMV